MSSYLYELIVNNPNEDEIIYEIENNIKKVDFQYLSMNHDNAFFVAVRKGKNKVAQVLLNFYLEDDFLFDINNQDLLGDHVLHIASQHNNIDFLFLMIQFEKEHPGLIEWNIINEQEENFLHCFLDSNTYLIDLRFFDFLMKNITGLNFEQQAKYDLNPLEVVMENVLNSDGELEEIYPFFEILFKYHSQHHIDFSSSIDWNSNLLTLAATLNQKGSMELMDLFLEHLDLIDILHVDNYNKNILACCSNVLMAEKILSIPQCQDKTFIEKAIQHTTHDEMEHYFYSYLEKQAIEKSLHNNEDKHFSKNKVKI
jgi:hypothetical protein